MNTMTDPPATAPVIEASRMTQVVQIVSDPRFDRSTNLARLQGWRGDDLQAYVTASPVAHRIGPALCGTLSIVTAVTGSIWLLLALLTAAVIGVFAPNHPAETAYNAIVRRRGGHPIPANRAAKRLGCAVGSMFMGSAAVAIAFGATTLATGLLVFLGSLALFVASTGICVPSMVFTLFFGVDRATHSQLLTCRRR